MALPPILALSTEPTMHNARIQWKARVGKSHTRTAIVRGRVSLIGVSLGRGRRRNHSANCDAGLPAGRESSSAGLRTLPCAQKPAPPVCVHCSPPQTTLFGGIE